MKLPPLPKQHKKREADASLVFRNWLTKHPMATCSFEMKQTTTDTFLFSQLKDTQIAYAEAIESNKGVLIRVEGHSGEPDYVYLRREPAYVVIRYPDGIAIIGIEIIKREMRTSSSLNVYHAKDIATLWVTI